MPKRRSRIRFFLLVLALGYLSLLLMLTGCQKRLIYYPERASEDLVLTHAGRMGLEVWRDREGELIGWQALARAGEAPAKRVVVFHGNAGMALGRRYYVDGFQSIQSPHRWDVYLFEYPGYGSRTGVPGERVFYEGAREAVSQLLAGEDAPLFLLGESLGSGVASRMAAEFADDVDGLILITPFTTLPDVAAKHFPAFPVRLLLRERYDNVAALGEYGGPVAIVLAGEDEVIPAELGKGLYEAYSGPKAIWVQEGSTHNGLDLSHGSGWWRELADFLDGEW